MDLQCAEMLLFVRISSACNFIEQLVVSGAATENRRCNACALKNDT